MARIKYLLIFILLLIASPCFATTWTTTVTQAGGGGACQDAGECSAAEFNALSGDYSDSTFNFSGTFTTRIVVSIYGTSGHPVTLDGYSAGDCDPINDCDEINFTCDGNTASSAILSQGLEIGNGVAGPDYINIYDFRMTRSGSSSATFRIYTSGSSDGLNIKRNYVYDSDAGMFYLYKGNYATIEGNKFYTFGQGYDVSQGFNIIDSNDLIIRGNEIGHNESGYPTTSTSTELIELHGVNRGLIEYNDIYGAPCQSGIRPKEDGDGNQGDLIIRFNKIHDNLTEGSSCESAYQGKGIYALTRTYQSINNVYVYGNFIYKLSGYGIMAGDGVDYFHAWSNIVADAGRLGFYIYQKTGAEIDHVYIYNNTVARGNANNDSDLIRGGMGITHGTNLYVKNNLLWNNRLGGAGSLYNQIYDSASETYDYNTYYHTTHDLSSGDMSYYGGVANTLAEWNAQTKVGTDAVADPGFTNPDGADETYGTEDDDYTLTAAGTLGTSLAQQFQVTIQGTNHIMNYDIGLDPDTVWTGNASTLQANVKTTNFSSYQLNRGAYVYFTDPGSPAPVVTDSANGLTNNCPNGADPISANFWLWTDIASYCKGAIKTTTCAGDYPDGYNDAGLTAYDNPGSTTHGLFFSVACGAAHTVCAVCSTTLAAGGEESDWTEITRTVAAEEGINPPVALTIHSDTSGAVQVTIHSDTSGGVDVTPY